MVEKEILFVINYNDNQGFINIQNLYNIYIFKYKKKMKKIYKINIEKVFLSFKN